MRGGWVGWMERVCGQERYTLYMHVRTHKFTALVQGLNVDKRRRRNKPTNKQTKKKTLVITHVVVQNVV